MNTFLQLNRKQTNSFTNSDVSQTNFESENYNQQSEDQNTINPFETCLNIAPMIKTINKKEFSQYISSGGESSDEQSQLKQIEDEKQSKKTESDDVFGPSTPKKQFHFSFIKEKDYEIEEQNIKDNSKKFVEESQNQTVLNKELQNSMNNLKALFGQLQKAQQELKEEITYSKDIFKKFQQEEQDPLAQKRYTNNFNISGKKMVRMKGSENLSKENLFKSPNMMLRKRQIRSCSKSCTKIRQEIDKKCKEDLQRNEIFQKYGQFLSTQDAQRQEEQKQPSKLTQKIDFSHIDIQEQQQSKNEMSEKENEFLFEEEENLHENDRQAFVIPKKKIRKYKNQSQNIKLCYMDIPIHIQRKFIQRTFGMA